MITIQKDSTRYSFYTKRTNTGDPIYCIQTEQMYSLGASLSYQYVTKDNGNQFYKDRMASGFKRFRNAREISWYATRENNTPFVEQWEIQGDYLVPIISRSLGMEVYRNEL